MDSTSSDNTTPINLWDLNDQQLNLKLYTHGDDGLSCTLDEHLFDESDLLYSLNARRNSLTLGTTLDNIRRNSLGFGGCNNIINNNSNSNVAAERRNSLRLMMERRNSLRNSLGLGSISAVDVLAPLPTQNQQAAVVSTLAATPYSTTTATATMNHVHAPYAVMPTATATRPMVQYNNHLEHHHVMNHNTTTSTSTTTNKAQQQQQQQRRRSSNSGRKKKDPSLPRVKVDHAYVDYSLVPDSDILCGMALRGTPLQLCLTGPNVSAPMQLVDPSLPKKQGKACFPLKLMCILRHTEELAHVITWMQHGRSFIVRDQEAFRDDVMPRFFKPTLYKSFIRQLSLWGFKRITRGPDAGSYYHELFLRGKPNLVTRMRCEKVKGTGVKLAPNPDMEPNFHLLAQKRPLFQLVPRRIPLPPSQGVYNVDAPFSHIPAAERKDNGCISGSGSSSDNQQYHNNSDNNSFPATSSTTGGFGEVYHRDETIMRRYSRKVSMQHDGPPIMYRSSALPVSSAPIFANSSHGVQQEVVVEQTPQTNHHHQQQQQSQQQQIAMPAHQARRRTSVVQSVDQIVRRRSLIADQHKALMNAVPRRVSMDMNIAAIQQVTNTRAQEAQQQQQHQHQHQHNYYSC
mmetsp:Transcript_3811/g.5518  ORF Transcript_3811/g.5518 Transcript_3811/m.5518 type:complete len:627 (-) Transcript_3811:143-2023(-)